MLNDLLNRLGPLVILIVVLGSIVDIVQFMWILKMGYSKVKERIYNQVRQELIGEEDRWQRHGTRTLNGLSKKQSKGSTAKRLLSK